MENNNKKKNLGVAVGIVKHDEQKEKLEIEINPNILGLHNEQTPEQNIMNISDAADITDRELNNSNVKQAVIDSLKNAAMKESNPEIAKQELEESKRVEKLGRNIQEQGHENR